MADPPPDKPDQIEIVLADPRSDKARACLSAYYAELARRFPTGFDVTLSRDPDAAAMTAPLGAFFLAITDRRRVGCVGLKGPGPVAEVKRLWVAPDTRGLGVGQRLMAAVERRARALGIDRLQLDTNTALPEAVAFYRRAGWAEIDRFNDDPYAEVFFEKRL